MPREIRASELRPRDVFLCDYYDPPRERTVADVDFPQDASGAPTGHGYIGVRLGGVVEHLAYEHDERVTLVRRGGQSMSTQQRMSREIRASELEHDDEFHLLRFGGGRRFRVQGWPRQIKGEDGSPRQFQVQVREMNNPSHGYQGAMMFAPHDRVLLASRGGHQLSQQRMARGGEQQHIPASQLRRGDVVHGGAFAELMGADAGPFIIVNIEQSSYKRPDGSSALRAIARDPADGYTQTFYLRPDERVVLFRRGQQLSAQRKGQKMIAQRMSRQIPAEQLKVGDIFRLAGEDTRDRVIQKEFANKDGTEIRLVTEEVTGPRTGRRSNLQLHDYETVTLYERGGQKMSQQRMSREIPATDLRAGDIFRLIDALPAGTFGAASWRGDMRCHGVRPSQMRDASGRSLGVRVSAAPAEEDDDYMPREMTLGPSARVSLISRGGQKMSQNTITIPPEEAPTRRFPAVGLKPGQTLVRTPPATGRRERHRLSAVRLGPGGIEVTSVEGKRMRFALNDPVSVENAPSFPVLPAGKLKRGDRIRVVGNMGSGSVYEKEKVVRRVEAHGNMVTVVFEGGGASTLPAEQMVRLAED